MTNTNTPNGTAPKHAALTRDVRDFTAASKRRAAARLGHRLSCERIALALAVAGYVGRIGAFQS